MSWRQKINLIHYNIWRFERWTRYLVFGDGKIVSIRAEQNAGKELDDCVPFAINNAHGEMIPNYSGKHFHLLVFLLILTFINIYSAVFVSDKPAFWPYGIIVGGVIAIVISFYLAPANRKKYVKDFKKFELMSKSEKRKSAFITVLLMITIWSAVILSFIFTLKLSIS